MQDKRMPVVFTGHGSPMLALEDSPVTRELHALGRRIERDFDKPKAILSISAHWYWEGTYVQTAPEPTQIYDMYGFPPELYQVKYPARGSAELSARVLELLGADVQADNRWGIDHGSWTVLVHLFPEADVPVVQLSVDQMKNPRQVFELGQALAPLRDEGYLILGSGNVVHNLYQVDWDHPDDASPECRAFNADVISRVRAHDDEGLLNWEELPHARYAVPTPDHYMPLLYALGAARGDDAQVFNDVCNLGSIAMTGFAFGM